MDPVIVTMLVLGAAGGSVTVTIAAMKIVPKIWNGRGPVEPPVTRAELNAEHAHSNGTFVRKEVCEIARVELGTRMADVQANVAETKKDVRLLLRHFDVHDED